MMNNKQMSIWYAKADHAIFKILVNGHEFYINKHDKRMKKLYDTGKIKEYYSTKELFDMKKEAEKLKRNQPK